MPRGLGMCYLRYGLCRMPCRVGTSGPCPNPKRRVDALQTGGDMGILMPPTLAAGGIPWGMAAATVGKKTGMRFRQILLLFFVAASASACAQATVRDCREADWFSLGLRDGLAGAPSDVFEAYRHSCSDADVTPDREAYHKGRVEGLLLFCTDANGFRTGRANKIYHHVCPPGLEKTFLTGRARGLRLSGCAAKIYVFEEHITSLEQALLRRERQMEALPFPAGERARLQREIDTLETLFQQAAAELGTVENRCLEAM